MTAPPPLPQRRSEGGSPSQVLLPLVGASISGSIPVLIVAWSEINSRWHPPSGPVDVLVILTAHLLADSFWLLCWIVPPILAAQWAIGSLVENRIRRTIIAGLIATSLVVSGVLIGQALRHKGFGESIASFRIVVLLSQGILFLTAWTLMQLRMPRHSWSAAGDPTRRKGIVKRGGASVLLALSGYVSLGISAIAGGCAWEPRELAVLDSVPSPFSPVQACVVWKSGPWYMLEPSSTIELLPVGAEWSIRRRGTLVWAGDNVSIEEIRWVTRDSLVVRVRASSDRIPIMRAWNRDGIVVEATLESP